MMQQEGNQQMAALTSAMNAFQLSNAYAYPIADGGGGGSGGGDGGVIQGSPLPPSLQSAADSFSPYAPYYVDPNLLALNALYPYSSLTPNPTAADCSYLQQTTSGSTPLPPSSSAYHMNALMAQQMAMAQGLAPFNSPSSTVNVTTMPISQTYSSMPMSSDTIGSMGGVVSVANAARATPTFGSSGHGAEPPRKGKGPTREEAELRNNADVIDPLTYKTEVCRSFLATGSCDYGDTCQFAHGVGELRSREFDAKYKTELCKNYHLFGPEGCSFGSRCKFIHDEYRIRAGEYEFWLISPSEYLVRVECVHPKNTARFEQLIALVNNPPKPPVSPLQTKTELKEKTNNEQKADNNPKNDLEPGTSPSNIIINNDSNTAENPSETFQTPAAIHQPSITPNLPSNNPPNSDATTLSSSNDHNNDDDNNNDDDKGIVSGGVDGEDDGSRTDEIGASSPSDPLIMLSRLPGLKEGVQPRLQFFTTAPSPKTTEKKSINQNIPQKTTTPAPPLSSPSDHNSPTDHSDAIKASDTPTSLAERQQKLLTLAVLNEKNPPSTSPTVNDPAAIDDQNKSDESTSDRDGDGIDKGDIKGIYHQQQQRRAGRKHRHRSSGAPRWQREEDDRSRAQAAALGLNLFDPININTTEQNLYPLPMPAQNAIQPGIAFLQNDHQRPHLRHNPPYTRINPPMPMNTLNLPPSSTGGPNAINVNVAAPFPFGMPPLQFPSFHIPHLVPGANVAPSNVQSSNIGMIPPY